MNEKRKSPEASVPEASPTELGIDPSSAAGGSWGSPAALCHQPIRAVFVPALFNHRARPVSIQKEGSKTGLVRAAGAVRQTEGHLADLSPQPFGPI